MSTLAQKLCDEIVEPILKPSDVDNARAKSASRNIGSSKTIIRHGSSKRDGKTTRSVLIEKKKIINKLVPTETTDSNKSSKTVINKFKSKETILKKKFVDIALNTVVSGPLRCDNDCVTMVRRRDRNCTCKCSQKRAAVKASVKQIQTFDKNYLLSDKACAQCIETASCGTQFLGKIVSEIRLKHNTNAPKQVELKHDASILYPRTNTKPVKSAQPNNVNKNSKLNYMGTNRWALSQYPIRGPDF